MSSNAIIHMRRTTRHTPIGVSGVVCDVLEVQKSDRVITQPCENVDGLPSSTPLVQKIFHVAE